MPPANTNRPIGLLLAAGRGRRMGGRKQWHLWPTPQGNKPLVAAAFDAIDFVCDPMVVVLGHEVEGVAELLEDRMFQTVLSDPDAPMFESIRAGLNLTYQLNRHAHVLLHLADHPEVAESTLQALLATAAEQPDRAILPDYRGRGGHPVLIPPAICCRIQEANSPGGLRQFWLNHPELCVRLPVDDQRTIHDIDTP
jgi:molybdenum cofactor cytidylyltransferase